MTVRLQFGVKTTEGVYIKKGNPATVYDAIDDRMTKENFYMPITSDVLNMEDQKKIP